MMKKNNSSKRVSAPAGPAPASELRGTPARGGRERPRARREPRAPRSQHPAPAAPGGGGFCLLGWGCHLAMRPTPARVPWGRLQGAWALRGGETMRNKINAANPAPRGEDRLGEGAGLARSEAPRPRPPSPPLAVQVGDGGGESPGVSTSEEAGSGRGLAPRKQGSRGSEWREGKSCDHLTALPLLPRGRGLRRETIRLHRPRRSAGSGNSAGKAFSGRFGKTATWC